jgi:transcription antitermination factor NusG
LSVLQQHWYAVHVRSNYEQRAARELSVRNFEMYLPVFRELHRWKDRKKLIERPLFPGYLFVHIFDSASSRLAISKIDGVVRILGQGDRIEAVAEEEIDALRRLLNTTGRCLAHPLLREGAWVRVKSGALEGLEGLLVGVKSRTRLVLSVTLLSQSVSTEIDASDVEFLRSPRASSVESRGSNQLQIVAASDVTSTAASL